MEGPLAIHKYLPWKAMIYLQGPGGETYPVQVGTFVEAIRHFPVQGGCILGRWEFAARSGGYYHLRPVVTTEVLLD